MIYMRMAGKSELACHPPASVFLFTFFTLEFNGLFFFRNIHLKLKAGIIEKFTYSLSYLFKDAERCYGDADLYGSLNNFIFNHVLKGDFYINGDATKERQSKTPNPGAPPNHHTVLRPDDENIPKFLLIANLSHLGGSGGI